LAGGLSSQYRSGSFIIVAGTEHRIKLGQWTRNARCVAALPDRGIRRLCAAAGGKTQAISDIKTGCDGDDAGAQL
jgi:hypothetical protein